MDVSIIIPIYNVSKFIVRCLNSVFHQTYKGELECILVDDMSPDDSLDKCLKLLNQYKGTIQFKIIRHLSNKGLSGARNTGIKEARGKYIFFLDSDDYITPNCIEILFEKIKRYPNVDIIQGNLFIENKIFQWLELSQYHFPEYSNDYEWIKKHFLTDIPVTAWNKLIKKELIIKHNLFFKEGILHEDEHWRLFAFKHIKSICFCQEKTYFYTFRTDSIMHKKFKDQSYKSIITIAKEYIFYSEGKDQNFIYRNLFFKIANGLKQKDDFEDYNLCLSQRNRLLNIIYKKNQLPLGLRIMALYLLHLPKVFINNRIINLISKTI